jgi:hypothetical protein
MDWPKSNDMSHGHMNGLSEFIDMSHGHTNGLAESY